MEKFIDQLKRLGLEHTSLDDMVNEIDQLRKLISLPKNIICEGVMPTAIEQLENWLYEDKGRYVREINHECGYGATCWSVILGNTDMEAKEGWHIDKECDWAQKYKKAEVYADEVSFWEYDESVTIPPNLVWANNIYPEDDWPGLDKTIIVAVKKARELGI